jgi:VWFA-related protein
MFLRQPASILVCLVCAATVGAQRRQPLSQPPPQPAPQFRAGVELVRLDVSVLDRDRRPVRGLTPADFTILENGVPQKIAAFNAVDIPDPVPPPTGWMRDVAPDVRTNERIEERRLFLMLLDDAMIQADPRAIKNARDIARVVIDQLGPSDLAALVFTRDNRHSQDYTGDRARLLAAAEKFTVGFRDMGKGVDTVVGPDDLYFMYSVNVMESAVNILTSLPDRRKSIIYIGQGLPVDLEMAATPQAPGLPPGGGPSGLAQQGLMSRVRGQMLAVFERARLANVNVYTIDACGLRAPQAPWGIAPTCLPGLEVEYLRTVAENTGAVAVVDTNEFASRVDAIFEENASYYLLGYQSTDPRRDGKLRRIDVRVNRPGVEVRTRSGYRAERDSDARRKAELAKSPLGAALAGVLPKSDLPLQATAAAFPLPGRRESAVAIVVAVRQPLRPNEQRHVEKVDLQVSAYDVDGRHYGSKRLRADVAIRAGASGLAAYEVLSRLDLRPGRYQLRIGANVGSLSTTGSLYYDVDVPDPRNTPFMLSGVVLTTSSGPVVAPLDAFKGLIPVVPTSLREFSRSERAAAFVRVYRSDRARDAAAELRVRLLDDTGTALLDRTESIAAAAFTKDRTADVSIDLPLSRLRAGEYLLTIEAGAAASPIRRAIRFEVRD